MGEPTPRLEGFNCSLRKRREAKALRCSCSLNPDPIMRELGPRVLSLISFCLWEYCEENLNRQSCYPSENSITLSAENYLYARNFTQALLYKIIQFCLIDGEAEVQSPSTRCIASRRLNFNRRSSLCYETAAPPTGGGLYPHPTDDRRAGGGL